MLFKPSSLENHPRRPPASFCTHPELRKPTFDEFLCNFHICFYFFDLPKYRNPTFSYYFSKQALKPCPDCRSRRVLPIGTRNISKDLHLKDLLTKPGRDFLFFGDTRYMPGKMLFPSKNHHPDKRKVFFFIFSFLFRQ